LAAQRAATRVLEPGFRPPIYSYVALDSPRYRENSYARHTWQSPSRQTTERYSVWVRFPRIPRLASRAAKRATDQSGLGRATKRTLSPAFMKPSRVNFRSWRAQVGDLQLLLEALNFAHRCILTWPHIPRKLTRPSHLGFVIARNHLFSSSGSGARVGTIPIARSTFRCLACPCVCCPRLRPRSSSSPYSFDAATAIPSIECADRSLRRVRSRWPHPSVIEPSETFTIDRYCVVHLTARAGNAVVKPK
jgi:hypothetical protein